MSTLSRVIFDIDTTAPTIPLGVAALALSSTSIRTTWNASTDAGGSGLAGYRVYRSLTLAGTYSLISPDLSTASLSYDDLTLSPSQQRFYKVSAFDGNGNASALSAAVNATTQAGAVITGLRFNPGWYVGLQQNSAGTGTRDSAALRAVDTTKINEIRGQSGLQGVNKKAFWRYFEGPTEGDYTRAYDLIDYYLAALTSGASPPKRLIISIWPVVFSDTTSNIFPEYFTASDYAQTSIGWMAKIWETTIMSRLIALNKAITDRYASNQYFEMITTTETAIDFNVTPSGYSLTKWLTELKRLATDFRANAPTVQLNMGVNYLGNNAQMYDLLRHCRTLQVCCGGPDTWGPQWIANGHRGLQGDMLHKGVLWPDAPAVTLEDMRDTMFWKNEVQNPEIGGYMTDEDSNRGPFTMAELFDTINNVNRANYAVVEYNTTYGGAAQNWSTGQLPFMQSTPLTHLTNPYTETFDLYVSPTGNVANSGTLNSPLPFSALTGNIAGKRVGLLNGTYVITGNGQVIVNIANAAGATIKAVNARQAVITSNNGGVYPQFAPGCPALIVINSNNVTLDGLRITDLSGHAIAIQAAANTTIRNCEISNIRTSRNTGQADTNCGGVYFLSVANVKDGVLIENCLFKDIYNDGGSGTSAVLGNTSNGVGDLFGARNVTVRKNTFVNLGTPAYWKQQTGNITFENNFCYNVGTGLQSFSTTGIGNPSFNRAKGNIFVCNSMGGAGSSNNNGIASSTLEHEFNTIIMKPIGGQTMGADFGWFTIHGSGSNPQGMRLSNNIIYLDASLGAGPGIVRVYTRDWSGQALNVSLLTKLVGGNMDNNVWNRYDITDGPGGTRTTSIATFRTLSGKEANSIVAAPDLVNINGNTVADFAPNSTSPAISRSAGHTFYGTSWGADFAQTG